MKAKFIALAALVLGLASCQQDFDAPVQMGGEVDFQLSVAATELAGTRAGENGQPDEQNAHNSAFGAIDYLQGGQNGDEMRVDWGEVDLRYSLEVYDVTDDYTNAVPVKDRLVEIVDTYEAVSFDLRLVPNREYRFVVFADFVEQGANDNPAIETQRDLGLHHVIGENLGDIKIKADAINDECTDAYFYADNIEITNSAAKDIVLERPYGKVRVIATDLAELNLNVTPKAVKVAYTAKHPQTFNAVTGAIGTYEKNVSYVFDSEYNAINSDVAKGGLVNHFYTSGYEENTTTNANGVVRHTNLTLFTDYILAAEQTPIHFNMSVYEDKECQKLIKETVFNTDIPVERNKLTTVIGNVLTTATEINVTIDDNFETFYNYNLWNGKDVKEPENDGINYYIYETSELAWVAQQVNEKGQKFNGKTFWLCKDLHLNHERWTPIGANGKFEGTFDGQDHKIEGVFVTVKGKVAAGLFANAKYVKNLTVLNSQIYGQYKAGVIVGDGLCSRITNCHVDGCEVVSTPYNKDEANNVGGIVGYLSAEGEAYVKDCTVKNSRIEAYRKVGGIVGSANQAAEVSGNRVDNVHVFADMTAEYNGVWAADAGAIVGYVHANATVKDNTIGEDNSVTVLVDTNQERDESYAVKDEVIHVTFKEGTYDFSQDLKVNGAVKANLGGTVVLNVENKTITSGTTEDYGLIAKGEGNTLVINNANAVSYGGGVAAGEGAKVIFNSGKVDITKYTKSSPARYNFYARGGEIEINGGEFTFGSTNKTRRAYVCVEGGGKVIINGGTFGKASTRDGYTGIRELDGEVIIYGGTFGFDPSAWVAQGYVAKKEGANWVVGLNKAESAAELNEAIANASEGDYIHLAEDVDYGAIYLGELKNVTIEGTENTDITLTTDANTVIENVTLKNIQFVNTTEAKIFITIDQNATVNNLAINNCVFEGTGGGGTKGVAVKGSNANATITINNTTIKNVGYGLYSASGGGYKALNIENCVFENTDSWAILLQYGYTGSLTINNSEFNNCDGIAKTGKNNPMGGTFTFTNNIMTNKIGHDGADSKCFEVNTNYTAVVDGNTKDGVAWTPGAEQGLK